MKMSERKVKLIILVVVILAGIVTLGYFVWDFYRPVDYVTRRPVYHRRFTDASRIIQGYQGIGVVYIRNNRTHLLESPILIIDIETGRELMRFQGNRNWRHYIGVEVYGDGLVMVRRSLRTGVFDNTFLREWAILELESGRELIPFTSEYYKRLEQVSDGLVIVRDMREFDSVNRWRRYYGVINIESGEITVPFEYTAIKFLSNYLISARTDAIDELGVKRDYWGVIDGDTGEIVWPFQYRYISPLNIMGEGLVRVEHCNGDIFIIDIITEEELFRSNQFIRSADYGMAVVERRENFPREVGLIEIESGKEVLPFGIYCNILILNENSVLVSITDRLQSPPARNWGIINIHNGEEVVPVGEYALFNYLSMGIIFQEGLILARYNNEQAIIDVTTGEKIIPFGTYNIHQLLPGGFITISDGSHWRIEKVQR